MNCPKCGKEIKEGKKFCSGCGWKLPEKVEKVSTEQAQSKDKEVATTTKLPDYIKYIIGGVIAVVLVIAFPIINILIKSHIAQSQFTNYKKGVEIVMQEIDEALAKQNNISKKYYYNQNAIIGNVFKKHLKYEPLPNNNFKFLFSNGMYIVLMYQGNDSRHKCDLFVEGAEKQKSCMIAKIQKPLNEESKNKYGDWGQDSNALRVFIYPNKVEKFGKW